MRVARLLRHGLVGAEPTLLANLSPDMRVYDEEISGRVGSLFRARDIDEAIAVFANGSGFGLAGSAWTEDESEQQLSPTS